MIVRLLQPNDERGAFSCGEPEYDVFLRQYAGQNQFRHKIGSTLVVVEDEVVLGYATFSAGELHRSELPEGVARGLPRHPLPVLRLTRLAVDSRVQGLGIGTELVTNVLLAACRMQQEYGCLGVLVDALPGRVEFYSKLGFEVTDLRAGRQRGARTVQMLLPLKHVVDAASR